jgi:hypothetical protein
MTAATFNRLDRIGYLTYQGKALSDSDVLWAVGLLRSAPVKDTPQNRIRLHIFASSAVASCNHLTEKQEHEVYQAEVRLTNSGENWDRITGLVGLGLLGDPRALPALRRIVASTSPTTDLGRWARWALRQVPQHPARRSK